MSDLRDPRAFKVVDDDRGISFPKDDDVLAALLKGDRPSADTYKVECYRTGQTIPAGRLPRTAAAVFVARGIVVAIEKAAPPASVVTPPAAAKPATPAHASPMPAAPTKNGGRP